MEFTLLWAVLTAVALGWLGLRIWPHRLPDHAFDRLLSAGLTGLIAGRLTAMLAQGINPVTNPGDFIVIRGGVHTGAATLAFVAMLAWSTRGSPQETDAIAPAALLALAGWHGGCLWRDACLGTPADLPWAWSLHGGTVARHPVEVYAALALVIAAWLVSRLGWRPWLRAGTALAAAAGIRLLTEPLRPSITGGPIWWYLAGVIAGGTAIVAGPKLVRARTNPPT